MAQTGAFMVLVAVKDIDSETVVISIPYLFNPSLFYCKKVFNKASLSGYYDYNITTTEAFIDRYDEICQKLLEIVDEHYSITFSCDSNTLHFTFRVVLSPHNAPKMCAHVLKYIISTRLATHGAPRIVFYDNLARQYSDLPQIKFMASTVSVDARLINLTAKKIAAFDIVDNAPIIFECSTYPEVYAKELFAQYQINSYIGGRDHLLIDNSDLDQFNKIDFDTFNKFVASLIDQLQSSGDILKYVKYGAVVINTPATLETILNSDNFQVKSSSDTHGGGDDGDDSDDCGYSSGDDPIVTLESKYIQGGKYNSSQRGQHGQRGQRSQRGQRGQHNQRGQHGQHGQRNQRSSQNNDSIHNLGNRNGHNNDNRPQKRATNHESTSILGENINGIAVVKQGKHNSCNIDNKPEEKVNGDRNSIRNKEGPLIHHVDESSSIYREVELPVATTNFEFAPNPDTLQVLLDYINMSRIDYDKLDKEKQLDVIRRFVRKNPHTYQVFCNKGTYTLYKAPGRLDRLIHDDDPVAEYRRRECEVKSSNHWGQRKLLLSEIEFLNLYAHKANNILYIGAAPGDHMLILLKMFPHMTIHMYDDQPFAMRPNAQFIQFKEYFTDAHAARYAADGKEWLIICDMRAFAKFDNTKSDEANESVVAGDMVDQEEWTYTIKPVASLLKFRLGWDDKKTRYMDGDIYIQIWQGESSTEARLLSARQPDGNMPPRRLYGNRLYEGQCYKHNIETRVGIFEPFNSNIVKHIEIVDTTPAIAATELIGIGITAAPTQSKAIAPETPTSGGDNASADKEVSFGPYYCCCYDCVAEIEILAAYLNTSFGARLIHNLIRAPEEPLIESALFIETLAAQLPNAPASYKKILADLITSPDWTDKSYAGLVAFLYEDNTSFNTHTTLLSALKSAIRATPSSTKVAALLDNIATLGDSNAKDFVELLKLMSAATAQIRAAPQAKSPKIAAIDFTTANPESRDIILKLSARISFFLNMFIAKSSRQLNALEFGDPIMPTFTNTLIKQIYMI